MSYEISIRQAVTAWLDALKPEERMAAQRQIERLDDLPEDPIDLPGVVRVSPRDTYYTLDVTTDLHIYFRVDEAAHRVDVMGLARREAIREYHRRLAMTHASP
jgi:mRNA-degrading endonuclease RelE of RelBE toxin-antitoxin system